MDSLTDKGRIEAINNYFSKKTFPAKFIFRVNGIKGKENLTIGDIEIYNPLEKQLTEEYDETFDLSDEQKASQSGVCNIAISVDAVDGEFGKHQAILKANTFFDCFASNMFSTKTKILIDTTHYFILDEKNRAIGSGFRPQDKHLNYHNSKRIENFKDTKKNICPTLKNLLDKME